MFKTALDVMRRADHPLTSREIAKRMLQERGLKEPSEKLITDTVAAIHASLKRYKGQRVTAHENQWPVRWSVKQFR